MRVDHLDCDITRDRHFMCPHYVKVWKQPWKLDLLSNCSVVLLLLNDGMSCSAAVGFCSELALQSEESDIQLQVVNFKKQCNGCY